MKKSEIVRNIIAQAKTNGLEMKDQTILDDVIAQTGLDKPLARTYIKNNWDKVVLTQPAAEVPAAEATTQETTAEAPAAETTEAEVAEKPKKVKKGKKNTEAVAEAVGAAFEAAVNATTEMAAAE